MLPVPAPTVNRNDIAGARKTTDLGRRLMTFAATDTIQSMPPAACMVEAAVITVMTMKTASTGALPGASPKKKMSTATPTSPQTPSPIPLVRVPM